MILVQNFKFLLSVYMVKMNLVMTFRDVLECSRGNPDHIWACQIWAVAILDFSKGVSL